LGQFKWTTIGIVVSTFSLGSIGVFMLSEFIPFVREMSFGGRIAVSILAGSILVARSPSSAIAVINELRARGPFTQTVLGVTVIMDGVVITLFAINFSIADAILAKMSFDFGFLYLLLAELLVSLSVGFGASKVLVFLASRTWKAWAKITATLLSGYSVFVLSDFVRHFTSRNYAFEVLLEPLLICMIAGFLVSNRSHFREEFLRVLHHVGPLVYLLFFTLIGSSLNLSTLANIWPIALTLFVIRGIAIFAGSFAGGMLAKDPIERCRFSWMGYMTQAGISMGLATQVAVEFPEWGDDFATLMIATIVLNQIVGPTFFKSAIHMAKEAHPLPEKTEHGVVHNAIIFGMDGQALALARHLHLHHWQVKLAGFSPQHPQKAADAGVIVHEMNEVSVNELRFLGAGGAGAIVAMLSDEENLHISQIVREHFPAVHLVVQLNSRSYSERFRSLGASVVVPSTAMISLLDHFVRSPSAVSLLLGMEKDRDIIDLEMRNKKLLGSPLQDLAMPVEALVISIHRGSKKLNVHDHLLVEEGDIITVAGTLESLEELRIKFEGWPAEPHA